MERPSTTLAIGPTNAPERVAFDDGSAFRAIMSLERSADRIQAVATERARAAWAASQGMDPRSRREFEAAAAAHQAAMTTLVSQLRSLAAMLLRTAVNAGQRHPANERTDGYQLRPRRPRSPPRRIRRHRQEGRRGIAGRHPRGPPCARRALRHPSRNRAGGGERNRSPSPNWSTNWCSSITACTCLPRTIGLRSSPAARQATTSPNAAVRPSARNDRVDRARLGLTVTDDQVLSGHSTNAVVPAPGSGPAAVSVRSSTTNEDRVRLHRLARRARRARRDDGLVLQRCLRLGAFLAAPAPICSSTSKQLLAAGHPFAARDPHRASGSPPGHSAAGDAPRPQHLSRFATRGALPPEPSLRPRPSGRRATPGGTTDRAT